jgi:hypothetical protein
MPFYTTERFHNWKVAKQKEQLHKAIIEAGFCPSQFLMGKLTILRQRQDYCLKEDFYLVHDVDSKKLLLTSIFFESEKALTLNRNGGKIETFVFEDDLTIATQNEGLKTVL